MISLSKTQKTGIALLYAIVVIILIAVTSSDSLSIVTLAFLPLLLYAVLGAHVGRALIFSLPLILSVLFFIMSLFTEIFQLMNVGAIIVYQLLFNYVLCLLFTLFGSEAKTNSSSQAYNTSAHVFSQHNSDVAPSEMVAQTSSSQQSPQLYERKIEQLQTELHMLRELVPQIEEQAKHLSTQANHYLNQIRELQEQQARDPAIDSQKYEEFVVTQQAKYAQYESFIAQLQQQLHVAQSKITITEQNVPITLRTIEDKCKAINFVIGRVYADKRGGNEKMRQSLHIDREQYNSFSEITLSQETASTVKKLVMNIQQKLFNLDKPEVEVVTSSRRSTLVRSPKDTVVQVLAKNDADPVQDYFSEAKDICHKLLAYIKENYGI